MRHRTSPSDMAAKKGDLFKMVEGCARHGRPCPSVSHFAALLRLSQSTVYLLMEALRNERLISWVIVKTYPRQKARIVTITESGMKTAAPARVYADRVEPAGPAFVGPRVRVLEGAEFEYWKGIYETRERKAAQRQMA